MQLTATETTAAGQAEAEEIVLTDDSKDDGMVAEVPSPEPRKRKRGRPPTRTKPSTTPTTPTPPPPQLAAALSRTGRRPNYKEASDDDDFDAPTAAPAADDEVDLTNTADADDAAEPADDATTGERDAVLESLLLADEETAELQRRFRDRIGKGLTLTHLERWFGPDSVPDEYYGLNGWLGRLPPGRILARRFIAGRHRAFRLTGLGGEVGGEEGSEVEGCFWYLYWMKGASYLHCRWTAEHHFMQFDESTGRITHFNKKRTADDVELDISFIAHPQPQPSTQASTATDESKHESLSSPPDAISKADHSPSSHQQNPTVPSIELSQPPAATAEPTIDKPSASQPTPQPDNTTSPLTLSDKDREAADLAAFLSKEDERKRARMRDIAAEREESQHRKRLLPLFDTDWLSVDRVVDHRRKRRERRRKAAGGGGGERTRKEQVEEQVEEYQKAMHAFALQAIQAMQQQQNGSHAERSEEDSDMAVTAAEDNKQAERAAEEAMEDETEAAGEDEEEDDAEDGPLAGRRRVEYEFLVKWKKLPYEQCTWETYSFLSAAHIAAQHLATPLASSTAPSSSPSPYVSAVHEYLSLVSRAAVRPASWIIPQSASARAAEARTERLRVRKQRTREKAARKAEQRKKAKLDQPSASDEHEPLAQLHDDEEMKGADEDELSASDSSDSDSSQRRSSASPSPPAAAPCTLAALSSRPPVTSSMRFGPSGMTLRPYQVDGVNWIVLNWLTGRNSILADEMGLGKKNPAHYTSLNQRCLPPCCGLSHSAVSPLLFLWLRRQDRTDHCCHRLHADTAHSTAGGPSAGRGATQHTRVLAA